ncbi:Uncharacterised protein [Klebsiella pneumoniae]|uniref:Uncharacterized protein n=1 Tax=Klebsiella pneumoniae TaxID=573 RepID=A0A378P2J8_KLEPN|nr:Uncharacterised protein [Klebsiella pneumoniae]
MRRNSQKWIPFGFDTVSNKIVDIASVENGLFLQLYLPHLWNILDCKTR